MLLALRHDSILWKGPSLAAVEREAGIGRFSSRQFHFCKSLSLSAYFPAVVVLALIPFLMSCFSPFLP